MTRGSAKVFLILSGSGERWISYLISYADLAALSQVFHGSLPSSIPSETLTFIVTVFRARPLA